jgi:lipopolysaccharide transport system permease protein
MERPLTDPYEHTEPTRTVLERETVFEPSQGMLALPWRELWEYHELLYFLVWRDIKVRYKQTVIGAAWAVIQPVLTMVVFSVFFGNLAKIPSDGIPYPIFAFTALLPWQLFANAVTGAGNSLVSSQSLITKVYFPRLIVPIAAVLAGLPDFGIAFVVLLGLMAWFGVVPTLAVLTLPLFVLLALLTALAVGLWLAALNVQYRDVRYTIPFLTQFWMYATPVAYPSSLIPEQWRALYGLNPLAGVVEGFRWALLGKTDPPGPLLLVSIASVAVLLITGLIYFQRVEGSFADVV